MEYFSVDPDQLDQVGSGLDNASEQLSAIWQSFSGTVSGPAAQAAGNDEIGGIIGEIVQVIFEAFDESITSATEELAEAGADVQEWAMAYRDADEAAELEFELSLSDLPGSTPVA